MGLNTNLMFSSETDMWSTPQYFFEKLHKVFSFNTDVCATAENTKCDNFYTEEVNGLEQVWSGVCWMNPPYGRNITGKWVEKAYKSAKENGATVVCLLPSRTDTKYWHDYCIKGEIYYIKGRLKFGGSKDAAPFPSALVVFRPQVQDAFSDC